MSSTLDEIVCPVGPELSSVKGIISSRLSSAEEKLRDLERHSLEARGKGIRPAVTLLSGAAAGRLCDEHIPLAAAAELIHTATLVHDDIIDGAELRRGRLTVSAFWGNSVAVLFGDYLLTQSFELLSRLETNGLFPAVIGMTREMCEGEISHLRRRYDISMTEDDYRRIIYSKTASLFSTFCRLSASLAGAPGEERDALEKFGALFGTAFQIVDDCLDITGTSGKESLKDLESGKVTLPIIKALAALSGADRENFAFSFRGGEVKKCLSWIVTTGAAEESLRTAESLMEQAIKILSCLPDNPSSRSLALLCDYIIKRGQSPFSTF